MGKKVSNGKWERSNNLFISTSQLLNHRVLVFCWQLFTSYSCFESKSTDLFGGREKSVVSEPCCNIVARPSGNRILALYSININTSYQGGKRKVLTLRLGVIVIEVPFIVVHSENSCSALCKSNMRWQPLAMLGNLRRAQAQEYLCSALLLCKKNLLANARGVKDLARWNKWACARKDESIFNHKEINTVRVP